MKIFLLWTLFLLFYAVYIIVMETIADKINNHLYRFLFRVLIQAIPLGLLFGMVLLKVIN